MTADRNPRARKKQNVSEMEPSPSDREQPSPENNLGNEVLDQALRSSIVPTLLERLGKKSVVIPKLTTDLTDYARRASELPSYSNEADQVASDIQSFKTSAGDDSFPAERSPNWVPPAEFAELVVDSDENLALAHVQMIRNDGISDEAILTQLLGPTSAALGERWEEDLSDFAEVTVGVCRLHRILRWLHPDHERHLHDLAHGGRVALAPVPGEQHSFGLLLVGDLLYRSGWYTNVDIDGDNRELPQTVADNWYHIVGISLSCESRLQSAIDLLADVRCRSANPDLCVMAGGYAFVENPDLARQLNVDIVSPNGTNVAELASFYIPNSVSH